MIQEPSNEISAFNCHIANEAEHQLVLLSTANTLIITDAFGHYQTALAVLDRDPKHQP